MCPRRWCVEETQGLGTKDSGAGRRHALASKSFQQSQGHRMVADWKRAGTTHRVSNRWRNLQCEVTRISGCHLVNWKTLIESLTGECS